MKRAAVQWGVGRYLYDLPTSFAQTSLEKTDGWNKVFDKKAGKNFWWNNPQLPSWALPHNPKVQNTKADFTEEEIPNPPKLYVVGKDKKEFDEKKLQAVVNKMAIIAGKDYGASVDEQNDWLKMPLDEAYNDIEKFVDIKKEEQND